MPGSNKRCTYPGCGKGGAYSFNALCGLHWDMLINSNILKFVEEEKKKK